MSAGTAHKTLSAWLRPELAKGTTASLWTLDKILTALDESYLLHTELADLYER